MSIWKKIFGKSRSASSQAHVAAESLVTHSKPIEEAPKPPSLTPASSPGFTRGKAFERSVQELLQGLRESFPSRVEVTPQKRIDLLDGRFKVIDFEFEYTLASSRHQIAVECQDRESWSTEIIDKILAIRNHSYRNRFWFVYLDDSFLSEEAKGLLKKHGILYFSLSRLRAHLDAVRRDLSAVDNAERRRLSKKSADLFPKSRKKNDPFSPDYEPPADPSMLSNWRG